MLVLNHLPESSVESSTLSLLPPERGLLKMTHCYINKGRNRSRLFVRERVELLIELSRRWFGNIARHTFSIAEITFQSSNKHTIHSSSVAYAVIYPTCSWDWQVLQLSCVCLFPTCGTGDLIWQELTQRWPHFTAGHLEVAMEGRKL